MKLAKSALPTHPRPSQSDVTSTTPCESGALVRTVSFLGPSLDVF